MAESPRSPGDRPSAPKSAARWAGARPRKPWIQIERRDRGELPLVEQLTTEVKRDWPGIVVSLGLHIALLFLAAVIPILTDRPPPVGTISLEWGNTTPPKSTVPPAPVQLTNPIQLTRPVPAPLPQPTPRPVPTPDAAEAALGVAPVDVGQSLGSRQPGAGRGGGRSDTSPDARQALDRALRWLVKQQQSDGRWSLDGPYADGATRTRWSTDVGATALALLALLGDGHTHQSGDFAEAVGKGLDWLVTQQRPNGEIYDGVEEGEEPSVYSHAISTIVLCETLALTGDDRFRSPAVSAVQFLVAAQNPVKGGWGYRPLTESGEGDLSVSGWALMALHTARMAQLDVDPQIFLLASSFIDSCQESPTNPSRYKYRPSYPPDLGQRTSMTSSGLLARQWLGWPRTLGPLKAGAEYLLSDEARPDWDGGHRNVYAWYYQAQMLHNLGGDRWQTWFADLQTLLVERQQTAGKEAGSWHPLKPAGSNHEWSAVVGRLYVTVMCALILETPNRHRPLYEEAPR